jgi:hypothetical protein
VADSAACPAGMEYTATATSSATPRAMREASHAFIRSTPSRTNSVSRGSAAKIADSVTEWATDR